MHEVRRFDSNRTRLLVFNSVVFPSLPCNVRTRAVHTALWARGNNALPHGGGTPPAPTPAPPHPAPQPPQHQGGGGGGRGGGRGGGNNGGPGIIGPCPRYSHSTPPWAGGHNPWTRVVHAYTMPIQPPPPRPRHLRPPSADAPGERSYLILYVFWC
jgi:hypothetical protein